MVVNSTDFYYLSTNIPLVVACSLLIDRWEKHTLLVYKPNIYLIVTYLLTYLIIYMTYFSKFMGYQGENIY